MQTAERAKAAEKPITAPQLKVLEYIKEFQRVKGYPPSNREIAEGTGYASSSTVHNHLDKLEDKGFIRRNPTKPRALEVIGEPISAEVTPELVWLRSEALRFQQETKRLRDENRHLRAENLQLRELLPKDGEPID